MNYNIKKVCVIGAGVMGSGIAASVANAKIDVVLLDIPKQNDSNRSRLAIEALRRLEDPKSTSLTHPLKIKYIVAGNLEDDLHLIKECDLVIEVIVEKLDVKHNLYNKILPYLKETAILASNTSTLSLASLKENLPLDIRKRFIILHFFNPPRFMELLELVSDGDIEDCFIKSASSFVTNNLGKTIIKCNDTPGFIANRVGCFLLELVVRKTIENNLNPVIIDKIFSELLKLPSTAIFGLYDLIGHDVMKLISDSLITALPFDDKYRAAYIKVDCLDKMLSLELLGRKTKSGFYRINEKKIKEVINFNDFSYSPIIDDKLEFTSIEELIANDNIYGQFFNDLFKEFYSYLIGLVPIVTDNISNIDMAMKLGYSWKFGPFELLRNHTIQLPYALNDSKIISSFIATSDKSESKKNVVLKNDSSCLYEYQEKLVFSINTKVNNLNSDVFHLLLESLNYCELNSQNLYIYSEEKNFSAGADLKYIDHCRSNRDFDSISEFILLGQKTMMRMKHSTVNIVSCASGVALGGGCELLLHSDIVVAHQNLNAGLVEANIGLIAGWGGVKEMFVRAKGDKNQLVKNINNILTSNKSSSADYFIEDYKIENCHVIANRDLMLKLALSLELPAKPSKIILVEIPKFNLTNELDTTSYNKVQKFILSKMQEIIDSGFTSESGLLVHEHEIFLALAASVNRNVQ